MHHGAFSVVIPAYQAQDTLPACLAALRAASPAPAEIIVYDDGSDDATRAIARDAGTRLIGDGANHGPAYGRNRGVEAARCPVVVFVDADVAVAPDAPGRLAKAVSGSRDVAAAFGAYGAAPSPVVRNLAGRYANLRHHHTHVSAAPDGPAEAETFWSGLGAVDRAAYRAVSGFDERYARPCIEDVELGLRLRAIGQRVLLVPDARGDHMKDWTLRQLWRTDVFERAVPWSRLAARGRIGATLNTGGNERTKSALAHGVWLLAAAALLAVLLGASGAGLALGAGAALCVLGYLALNRRFLSLLRADSPRTAAGGAALHWLYHCYASATYALVLVWVGLMTPMARRARNRRQALARTG